MVFEALFNKYHLDIARYCATRVGELLAEDVAQAVFGIVWRLSYVPGYDEVRAI
jgi:DNA-directed RNA polymerase specialized sigma24 family protein